MSFRILGMGSAVPPFSIAQTDAVELVERLRSNHETEDQLRFVRRVYLHAGIERRHSVLLTTDSGPLETRQSFLSARQGVEDGGPTTSARMAVYAREAPGLALRAAESALQEAEVEASQITHLVTVSCTGFSAPGVDRELMGALGLSPEVARTHIGFMGCHAALNGLRVARSFAETDSSAVILLVAVELCTLHHQYGASPDSIVANALFSDGAAALVGRVASAGDASASDAWEVRAGGSCILPESVQDMTWTIGDHGFSMTLSRRVPALIRSHLADFLDGWLAAQGMTRDEVRSWAIHPGGPSILTAAAEALGLDRMALLASDTILSRYGNMSSPTVLFLLEHLRRERAPLPCVALAFGPGLCVEATLLTPVAT
jgi:predicted naringenin-chalcone synthase